MSDSAALIPEWSQAIGTMLIGLVAVIIGVFRYVKTQLTKDAPTGHTSDILCIENRSLKDLTIAIRDHEDLVAREFKKHNRLGEELRESIEANTEASRALIGLFERSTIQSEDKNNE